MSSSVVIVLGFVLATILTAIAFVAATKPLPEEKLADLGNKIEELLPLHTQHFPQLRQALASTDALYMRQKSSKEMERMWREERHQILQTFLSGIATDFARLDRLAEVTGTFTSGLSRKQQRERIWRGWAFRFNYRIASMRVASGALEATGQLARLTEAVGSLSAMAEARMAQPENAENMAGRPGISG